MTTQTPPSGMITVKEYGIRKDLTEEQVIELIKANERVGQQHDSQWFVEEVQGSSTKEKLEPNKYQGDLNIAQTASKVGKTLSNLSMFLHIIVAVLVAAAFNPLEKPALVAVIMPIFAGILVSWAIIHSLLSIVVTNALTAKYTIYLASKASTKKV